VLDIRPPTEDDRAAIAHVAGLSFNYVVDPGRIVIAGSLCAYDGRKLVANARGIDLGQWFGGALVPCGGVAGVAVLPEYRGQGVARTLMQQLLAEQRADGKAISTLYPANSQLYRSLGYEFGGVYSSFDAPIADLPPAPEGVREMAEADVPAVMACFARYGSAHNGPVYSSDPARWTRDVLAHTGEGTYQRTVVVEGNDGLDGYASYFLGNWEGHGYAVHCKHFVAHSSYALRAQLAHFRRFQNAASSLAWHGPPSSAPVGLALSSTGFSLMPSLRRWMVRVLDVPRALEARGYRGASGELLLAVEDGLYPENSGTWRLSVGPGRAQVTQAEPAAAPAPLPIGLLSALFAGLVSARDLVALGALEGDDPRLATIDGLFGGPVPWMPDFF